MLSLHPSHTLVTMPVPKMGGQGPPGNVFPAVGDAPGGPWPWCLPRLDTVKDPGNVFTSFEALLGAVLDRATPWELAHWMFAPPVSTSGPESRDAAYLDQPPTPRVVWASKLPVSIPIEFSRESS